MFTNNESPKTLQECFERLKKGCEMLYDECNYSKDYSHFNPPTTEDRISDMEKRLGVALPYEYREFLKFSDGAKIMENCATIYGLNMIGLSDPMVPDGYLTIGEVTGDGERIAISEEDGEIYSCYNGIISMWSFENEMFNLLELCEEKMDEYKQKIEREKRRKAGITVEQEMYDIYVRLLGEERTKEIFEEIKRSKG